jgi:integrase
MTNSEYQKLNNPMVTKLKQHIQIHLNNKEFGSVFADFFEKVYSQHVFSQNDRLRIQKNFEKYLVIILGNTTIENISWEQYCKCMKIIRTQDWDLSIKTIARKLISELYRYIVEYVHLDTRGITELKEHQEFLIWEERSSKQMSELLFEKIGTNFPLESSIEQLYFIPEGKLKIKNNGINSANILNLNVGNGEIKNLLAGFFLDEDRPDAVLRHFLYLFRPSLSEAESEPHCITDFTFKTYEKQYRFYENVNMENTANARSRSDDFKFTKYLNRFYVYLCKVLNEQNIKHNIFEGTNYNDKNIYYYEGRKKDVPVRTAKLSSEIIEDFTKHIQNHLKDEEFKSIFLAFFKKEYSQHTFKENDRYEVNKYFEEYINIILGDFTIKFISWEQYCLSMKKISKYWNDNDRARRIARKMLSELFLYIIENVKRDTSSITELKRHKEFLIWEERKLSNISGLYNEFQLDRIGTNFPLDSSLDQLHLIPANNKSQANVLNLNIKNKEIKKLLLGFYLSESAFKHHIVLRQFIYLFRYSLLVIEKEPQSLTDFTFEVFKKQYRFYQNANILNTSTLRKFNIMLVRFYVYLCKLINEQNIPHNIFDGTFYTERILGSNSFSVMYEKGYKLITYNPFEEVPIENRWQLISSDGYANIGKNIFYGIDFTKVDDKSLREDLKNYIWKQSSMTISTVVNSIYTVIEFLNFISSYKRLNELSGNCLIVDADLLDQWSFYLGVKKTSTRNDYIKRCKSFLKFYKSKYQIPQLLIDSLTQSPEEYDGGNPMTLHDLGLFTEKFQKQKSRGVIGELCYIIFNLATTTKLRLGEILALERNCILETSEQTGVIKYYSKVTGNQKIKLTLPIEKLKLIEEAIRLTEDAHSKANEDIASLIFVKHDYWRKDRIIALTYQFWNTFSTIQKELEGQLNGKYRPYDLRTTFIDNLYTEGIKDGIPSSVIAEMAGNGEHTARKYYRKTKEIQEYAEMFAGVTISGVDVYGNILEEESVEELNPVEDGLGGCRQEGCVNDEDEYQCLICSHFATTTNRITLFKERITRLKIQKESTLNSCERSAIDAQLKLYTAYYVRLLEKIGGE